MGKSVWARENQQRPARFLYAVIEDFLERELAGKTVRPGISVSRRHPSFVIRR
jgi:hypothetical protein